MVWNGTGGTSPGVSWVMSVHNGATDLQAALDSMLGQIYRDFELVVIDDGSTDQTREILSQACGDPRVVLLQQERQGLAHSLNRGIAAARGEYVARHDADDLSVPDRLARQVAFLDAHPEVGMVGSQVMMVDVDGDRKVPLDFPLSHQEIVATSLQRASHQHGAILARRTALEAIGGYREQFPVAQDSDLFLRVMEQFQVANLPETLYYYRRTRNAVSFTRSTLQFHYVEIARELARERRATGSDIFMQTEPTEMKEM